MLVRFPTPADPHHLKVQQRQLLLIIPQYQPVMQVAIPLPATVLTKEHLPPITHFSRQSKSLIQTYLIQNGYAILEGHFSHPSPHLLQILRQRQRRSRQLYKLHLRTVKPLRKNIHIHNHINP